MSNDSSGQLRTEWLFDLRVTADFEHAHAIGDFGADIEAMGAHVDPGLQLHRPRSCFDQRHLPRLGCLGRRPPAHPRHANGTLTAVPEIVLADDENVLMYMKVTASRPDGRTYDSHQSYRYRLKDGLVIEGETIPVDQEAFKEFFA